MIEISLIRPSKQLLLINSFHLSTTDIKWPSLVMEFQKTNWILKDDKTSWSFAVPSLAWIEIATYKLVGSYQIMLMLLIIKVYLDNILVMLCTILYCPSLQLGKSFSLAKVNCT